MCSKQCNHKTETCINKFSVTYNSQATSLCISQSNIQPNNCLHFDDLENSSILKHRDYYKYFNDKIEKKQIIHNTSSINNYKTKENLAIIIPCLFKNLLCKNAELNLIVNTVFDITSELNINFQDYIIRLMKHTDAESNSIIYALCLIDKLCDSNKLCLTYKNIHKVFFISLIISIKWLEDFTFSDKHYSKCGGISLKEYIVLESSFIYLLDYKVQINDNKFDIYKKFIDN